MCVVARERETMANTEAAASAPHPSPLAPLPLPHSTKVPATCTVIIFVINFINIHNMVTPLLQSKLATSISLWLHSWRISIGISRIYIIMFISIDDYSAYVCTNEYEYDMNNIWIGVAPNRNRNRNQNYHNMHIRLKMTEFLYQISSNLQLAWNRSRLVVP